MEQRTTSLLETWMPPGLYFALRKARRRKQMKRFRDSGQYMVAKGPLTGLKLTLTAPDDDSYQGWIERVVTGQFEPAFIDALAAYAQAGGVLYDIGAHIGIISCAWRHLGGGQVVGFEPNPTNLGVAKTNILANGGDVTHLIGIAVSDRHGRFGLQVDNADFGQSSKGVLILSERRDQDPTAMIEVNVETLDGYRDTKSIPPPSLIKIDVEGTEAAVLRGATRTIQAFRPKIIIETHSLAAAIDTANILKPLNYSPTVLDAEAPVPHVLWIPDETITHEG
jgi:FkbM family methyltransferase